MTTNLHDKMLAAIDALFSASDAVEEEVAENLLLDVRDEINKHKLAAESLNEGLRLDDWDKIGCVNHDCDQCKALAEQPAQQVEWVDAGDLKQLKKGDVIRVIRNGEVYYSPFGYCGVLEECDYAYYREPSQFVYLEVGTATVEKIVYTRKDFATGAVYANRGDRVEVAHGITKGNT